jgi:hypothetical protein
MAITIFKEKTKQKYLLVLLGVAVLGAIFLVWQRFFQKPSTSSSLPLPAEEIKINFSVLENPFVKELQPFPEIPPFEGQIGRVNPLAPYQK